MIKQKWKPALDEFSCEPDERPHFELLVFVKVAASVSASGGWVWPSGNPTEQEYDESKWWDRALKMRVRGQGYTCVHKAQQLARYAGQCDEAWQGARKKQGIVAHNLRGELEKIVDAKGHSASIGTLDDTISLAGFGTTIN
ncbi:hypothetical protein RB195_016357 [Necator americanus]|uniref:Uncharacterized protein n=1 Tax=Necator americanus TaxID=51031 RepID=A0ABR1EAP9_NECAM